MSSKRRRKAGAVVVALAIICAAFAASVQAATPKAGYTQFAGCPTPAEQPHVETCVHSVVTGGHVKLGNKDVPLANQITLTGGTNSNLENFVYNSQGGLSPTKQKVPGGVIGLTGLTWLLELLGSEALTLYAVTELAGQPKMNLNEVTLPVKVHLINPVLGSKCYVGSTSSPIVLNLVTSTTNPPPPATPIKGVEPTLSFDETKGILHADNGKYVDNAFSAPGANGCTLTLFGFIPISINSLVNAQSGLPSPAGKNEAEQIIDTEITPVSFVY